MDIVTVDRETPLLEGLLLARELKLFKLGTVAIDSTHLKANPAPANKPI
ncbi:hypothetical protein [Cerasicoccus maritimus]|nr:hypothetical protein [Cerasicoccus maritimus]